MSKKTAIISTLILAGSMIGSLASTLPTQAEQLTINGTDYWTMDEVMAESEEYEKTRAMCNSNRECEDYLEMAYLLAGGKYGAGMSFSDYYFMIAAINPMESSISVRFNDTAAMRWFHGELGKTDPDVLQNLYLFWWENGSPWFNVHDFTTESENRHEILTRLAAEGEVWLEPNQEVKLTLPDFDFNILKTTPIYFAVQSKLSDALSVRHFEECLTTIDGREGYECRAVFDELGNILYQPSEIKIAPSEPGEPTEPTEEPTESENTPTEESQNEPTPETISTSAMRVPENTAGNTTNTTRITYINSTLDREVPKTTNSATDAAPENSLDTTSSTSEATLDPQTGSPADSVEVPLAASGEPEHAFPWWIIIFAFSGIFLMLWWLIPAKKSEKKSKKTLDK